MKESRADLGDEKSELLRMDFTRRLHSPETEGDMRRKF